MKFKGKISEYGRFGSRPYVTLEVDANILDRLNELKDKALNITFSIFYEKRSLRANRFYWEILGQLAQKLRTSTTELHNQLLGDCGYLEYWDDRPVSIAIQDDINPFTCTFCHLKPTSQQITNKAGKKFTVCMVLRGSHTYNTAEMSHLIDLLVARAKEQGIDTLTEDEKQRMMAAYEKAHLWDKEKKA